MPPPTTPPAASPRPAVHPERWRLPNPRHDTARADADPLIRPADVGGPAAWQDLVHTGATRVVWDDVAVAADGEITPALRALAIRALVPRGTVLAGTAAAWVLCGTTRPRVLDVVYPPGVHRPSPRSGRAPRQAVVLRSEVVTVAGVPVTAPVRTALDVSSRSPHDEAVAAVLALVEVCGLDVADTARSLELRYRWAHRERARRVLATVLCLRGDGRDGP